MELTTLRYQVGQRLRHPQFGEGLVVEVHTDRGREVLEVVFNGELRRLSAMRDWELVDGSAVAGTEGPAAHDADAGPGGLGGPPAAPGPVRVWHPQGDALLKRWRESQFGPAANFDLRSAAEGWAGWAEPDRLVSLNSLRGVERFPHQLRACLRAMGPLNGRAILADEVGLGKTIEAGIILKEYLLRGAIRTVLVLVPASLCEQWRAELWEKFELDFVVSRGPAGQWGRHPLVISSLETARHERHRRRVRGANYDLVVVDEAHRLRNHLTLGWKFINDLNPRYLLLLTATPVQNDLRELYNLATLVRPGTVGTYSQFRRDFLTGHDKRAPRNAPRLRVLLQSVMIRARRSDTNITFAPRRVETLWVGQTAAERKLYREVSDFVADSVRTEDGGPGRRHYFTLVVLQKEMGSSWAAARSTLEKLSRNPDGLDGRRLKQLAARAAEVSQEQSKVRSLLKRITALNGEKCIVFTQFRSTQDAIVQALGGIGIEPAIFHGELGWREKEEALDRFRAASQVLVSTEAGGEGRNLQFCRIVINYDLPWNPMRVEQRIGRVHRLGQEHPVQVVNLVARGTIEAYVLEILDRKIRMFELVVGEIEEILGAWQAHGSFEDEVFRRWTESTNPRVRKRRFAELAQHLVFARRNYQEQKDRQNLLFPTIGAAPGSAGATPALSSRPAAPSEPQAVPQARAPAGCGVSPTATRKPSAARRAAGLTPRATGATRQAPVRIVVRKSDAAAPAELLPDGAAWRDFVGRWLSASGSSLSKAARGDWEVALAPALQKRWRRQRVRLVFDPQRPTLPRGAWFTAPGSGGGRRILEAACAEPMLTRRTALVQVPGAPEAGIAAVCRVRGLTWGPPRLGPVRYERRVAFHVVVTLWGGLPAQEPWVMLVGPEGELLEWERGSELKEVRAREGLYQIPDALEPGACDRLAARAREDLDTLLGRREEEWERAVGRQREDELNRLADFFAARIEEEDERTRRRGPNGDESEMEGGDATSLKLEWERRAAEVRQRWSLRTEVRMWGLEEWSWPVADLEQELRAGAVRLRLTSRVDVARGRPALPACPHCQTPAEMLVRARGGVVCVRCAP